MIRRLSTVLLVSLCLLTSAAALAQPSQEDFSSTGIETLDIDWEATRQLIFLPLGDISLAPEAHEVRIRIHEQGQPVFFERVSFDLAPEKIAPEGRSDLVSLPLGLEILSHHREERAWLLERLEKGAELSVEIHLGDALLFDGLFADLVAQSDQFRDGPLRPVGTTAKLADLRPQTRPLKFCVDDCYDDHSECQEDFCYWDYDEYMCNEGCDLELDDCLTYADPVCEPPTCTPGVITTDTDTVLIGSQNVGLACMKDIFDFTYPYGSVYYNLYNLTYRTTTRELRRAADCSTTWVTISSSTFTQSCQQYTSIPCSFGWVSPACLI